MKYPFMIADVFTKERFAGNPLAIVFEADGLPDETMLKIAQEFNLSETIFVHKPRTLRHLAKVRIFTPTRELPFAGHPTVGVSVALGLRHSTSAVRLEEQIGTVVAVMTPSGKLSGHARFGLPKLPERVGEVSNVDDVAECLGLLPHQIGCGDLVPAVYSAGVAFTMVPVKDASVLKEIKFQRRGWVDIFGDQSTGVFVYSPTPLEDDVDYAARTFVDLNGFKEDPATGSAVSAMIGQLMDHGRFKEGQTDFVVRQGVEMGRPGFIEAQAKVEQGALVHAGLGGHVVITAHGELDLLS
ncbi:trans-2,3-dihydro-3-hydroxyanthranilate isomerase [Maritalea myrionectae]|uniref:Trans-2,3-dihydro-3-hydroxyanthranilate isomerase n=1 Tax=Maritalea myrionectae TaxID=454601 RepID=A0A2R4MD98_9HYPH|nr:PhzF family phenazine biosynthesis protein [Maritalea myrionectae]AVX04011.1 trans-2,3-dihydro-3-hydroxyanthranilate isomerase [Maritalea myrionectae]